MKNLFEFIEDCKLNEPVDGQDLRYAVIALTTLLNMASSKLMRFCTKDMGLAKIMQEDADVFALAISALKQVRESEVEG